jgi:ABC-2 type transport system ATP-binding protein
VITVQNLTRRYGEFIAVDGVSFQIGRGEVVGLLGHNGAGKTTIMRMLSGFLEPTQGSIQIDNLTMGPNTAAIQQRIGYLPENCPAWPEMTVSEFLEFQAELHNVPPDRRPHAIATAVRRTEIADRVTQSIQTLSRGYRQRVGVAQAILHSPDIIILDEPTNGLDPTQILHMRALIRELSQSATVIVSTHVLQEVQAVCERVLIVRAGRKVVDARLKELQSAARLLVTLDQPEAAAAPVLSKVAGVHSVQLLSSDAGRFHYALQADERAAPAVSRALYEAGFPLYRLTREQRTLDSLFAEVNALDAGQEIAHAA